MNRAVAYFLAFHAIFVVAALTMEADQLSEVIRAVLIVACVFGILRWIAGAWSAFKTSGKRASMGILAVVTLLTGILAISIYAVTFARLGRPSWLIELYFAPYFTAWECVGAGLFVLSSRFDGERPTKLDGPVTAVAAVIAVGLTTFGPWLLTKLGLIAHALSGALPRL